MSRCGACGQKMPMEIGTFAVDAQTKIIISDDVIVEGVVTAFVAREIKKAIEAERRRVADALFAAERRAADKNSAFALQCVLDAVLGDLR